MMISGICRACKVEHAEESRGERERTRRYQAVLEELDEIARVFASDLECTRNTIQVLCYTKWPFRSRPRV